MKKILIFAVAIFLSFNVFSRENTFRERTDNWLKEDKTDSGMLRGGIGNWEDPNGKLTVPVDTFPLAGIILCSGLYLVYSRKRRLANSAEIIK